MRVQCRSRPSLQLKGGSKVLDKYRVNDQCQIDETVLFGSRSSAKPPEIPKDCAGEVADACSFLLGDAG